MGSLNFNIKLPDMGSFSGIGSKITSSLGNIDIGSKLSGASGGIMDKLSSEITSKMGDLDLSSLKMPEIDTSAMSTNLDVDSEVESFIAKINSGNF